MIRHAGARRARAVNDQPLFGEGLLSDFQPGEDGGHNDGARALHIVVENAVFIAVLHKDATGIGWAEVFKMQQRMREEFRRHFQVFGDQRIVTFAAHAGVAIAEVGGVIEQRFVVGADIKIDSDGARGVDTCRCGVHRQLAHGNIRAVHAPVADAEDFFRVRYHQQIDIIRAEAQRRKRSADILRMVHIEIHSARAAVIATPLLDRLADGRVINNWQHFREMIGQELVVEHLVAVVQLVEKNVFLHVLLVGRELAIGACRLLVEGFHGDGQSAGEAIFCTFICRERGAFVGQRVLHDIGGITHRCLL